MPCLEAYSTGTILPRSSLFVYRHLRLGIVQNSICELYQNAQELSQEGAHVISTDEMTGVQALEHKYPDKLPKPGQCAKIEFEYVRHGTTSLIGFFDVATGRVQAPYLNATRTEEDFVKAVEGLISTDPLASWTFVCDGLNTHKSESLVRFVEKTCCPGMDLGKKGKGEFLKTWKDGWISCMTPVIVSDLSLPQSTVHG